MYQAIFFDMDETLLSLDEKKFLDGYVMGVAKFFEQIMPGQGKTMAKMLAAGSDVMKENHPGVTNEEYFWAFFEKNTSWKRAEVEPLFLQFYEQKFGQIEAEQEKDATIIKVVETLAAKGYPLIVATNPLLPKEANKHRLIWSGVEHINWQLVTGYEDCCYCKPSKEYFLEICEKFGYDPTKCLMIGNGMVEDMAAMEAGFDFYLLLDQVKGGNPDDYHGLKGKKEDLLKFVQAL